MKRFWQRKKRIFALALEEKELFGIEISKKRDEIKKIHTYFSDEHNFNWQEQKSIPSDFFTEKFKEYKKKYQIKAKELYLTIPTSQVVMRHLDLPNLPTSELEKIVQSEIGLSIHLPFEPAHFTLVKQDSEDKNKNKDQETKVLMVATSAFLIHSLVEGAKQAGFLPRVIDLPALSLFRYLLKTDLEDLMSKAIALINITIYGLDIHIIAEKTLWFTRHVELPLALYTNFSEWSEQNQKNFNAVNLLEWFKEKELYQSYAHDLLTEIERSLNFYHYSQNHRDKPVTIAYLLTSEHFPATIRSYLQDSLGINVEEITITAKLNNLLKTENKKIPLVLGLAWKEVDK